MRNTYKFNLVFVLVVLIVSLFTITSCSNAYSEFAGLTEKETYTVTFNANGGNEKDTSVKVILPINTVAKNKIPTVTRSNYTFVSWNTKADGSGTPFTSSTKVSSSITVYAQWTTLPTYTVTYNANNVTSGTVPAAQTKTQGIDLTLAANSGNLTKIGYTFVGWNTASDGSGTNYSEGANYTANEAVTLYAKWTSLPTYTVTYNTNGATSGTAPATQTKTQGIDLTLAINSGNLTKTGCTLVGTQPLTVLVQITQ